MVHVRSGAYACACVVCFNNLHLDLFPYDTCTCVYTAECSASLGLTSDLKQVGLEHYTCATTPTALFTCEATCVTALEWRSGTTIIEQYTPLDNVGAESTLTALGTTFTTNITHNVRVDPGDAQVVNITSTVAFPITLSLNGLVLECTDRFVSSSGTLRLTTLGECCSQAEMCICVCAYVHECVRACVRACAAVALGIIGLVAINTLVLLVICLLPIQKLYCELLIQVSGIIVQSGG